MTLIKKSDVSNYLAARRLKGRPIHIVPAVVVETNPGGFNKDFTADHSTSGTPLLPAGRSNSSTELQAPAAVGRVRK